VSSTTSQQFVQKMIRLAAEPASDGWAPGLAGAVVVVVVGAAVVVVVVEVVVVEVVVVDAVVVVGVVAVVLVGATAAGLRPVVGGTAPGGEGAHAVSANAEIVRTARAHHMPRVERCGPRLRMLLYRRVFVRLDGRPREIGGDVPS
jgi:hypothetical protein